ncbi:MULTISPECIES: xanthine dehydrogenase family protein subunit M [unclassified Sporosarcina]|uniref:FAD binding domain-containing protein n=1 Tax=unclassified Sporosarcina TaxID=2647733 RepID=UPI000C16464D|nr:MULTISPECIES: FAD binding domain-containing protein [unclassified Sporosarcina]PID04529.1 xanthine dehydrogenase [Sporosarcina sp. P30]PID07671.1 xanthine dehydrogenase [Sporosarcina sp. P31]PID10869.1 xanthine dehydrogenase [Sporosarcina sp. P32b]
MISFDFMYFQPSSITETIDMYNGVHEQGEKAMYISGGTEFITFARTNKVYADVIIDSKGIPECNVLEMRNDDVVIGAAVSLNKITNSNLFPFLGATVKQIADHTSRNKITIGGNINSELIYKESVLPLLLVDARVKVVKGTDVRVVSLKSLFDRKMKLSPGELLLQIIIDSSYIELPYISLKRTKFSKVGYPVVSVAAILKENQLRVAFSGVCDYPFRSDEIEAILNDSTIPIVDRIDKVLGNLPSSIVDDLQGSREYRSFVLKNVLLDVMEEMEMGE